VQRAEDVTEARDLARGRCAIMAKIEKPAALSAFDEILAVSDGIMVARGDLGVELPVYTVPPIQKRLVRGARAAAKPVIVATQMLESMIESPVPTRAEVSDVATAIYEGADAVMLSAETASGDYPLEAASMMSKIIRQVESGPDYQAQLDVHRPSAEATLPDAISCAIRRICAILPVAVLVNYTESGRSSLRASRERPATPILSLTPSPATARKLTVAWGVYSVIDAPMRDMEQVCLNALELARAQGMAGSGDTVLVTAGVPLGQPGTTNSLRIEILD
jgi:pyruvate kinase